MVYSERPETPCILFVDDHAEQRRFVKQTLEAEGYEVLTARNSVEALIVAADFPGSIDLLITDKDLRVCHNGIELAACFNVLRPETSIMFTSGNDEGDLAKPFSRFQLVEAVESSCALYFA